MQRGVFQALVVEGENAKLKKLLADALLDNAALKDLLAKNAAFSTVDFTGFSGMGRTTALSEPEREPDGGAGAGGEAACDGGSFPPPLAPWGGDQAAAQLGCTARRFPRKKKPRQGGLTGQRNEDSHCDVSDAAIKALGRQHADLDLHHVQPTGMLGDIVELQSAQHPSGLLSRECLVERAGRVGRQIVENDTDTPGLGKVNVSKFAHAGGEIDCGPALGDFHLAPRPMDVDEHEQIGGSITPIFATVALKLARLGRDRCANLADELGRALVEANHRPVRIGRTSAEIEHVLHPGNDFRSRPRSR